MEGKDGSLLALETSGSHASIALWQNTVCIGEVSWISERHHSSSIFPYLKQMLDMLGNSRLETIVVGAGPGSYGGIRVALAAADGISLIHGCRVVSLCSWEALPVSDAVTCHVISDARRNGWAVASFKDRRQKGDITILSTGELIKVIPVWQQQNETVYSPETAELLSTLEISGIVAEQVPEARLLGKAWLKRNASERQTLLEHNPSPIYVRPPHITEAKRPAWATRKQ